MKYYCDRNIQWNIPGGPEVTAHTQVKCKQGETDTKGGTCICTTCCNKRNHYDDYKEYRKTLKKVHKKAISEYYSDKFLETQRNSKKTWGLINKIRGKQKRDIIRYTYIYHRQWKDN